MSPHAFTPPDHFLRNGAHRPDVKLIERTTDNERHYPLLSCVRRSLQIARHVTSGRARVHFLNSRNYRNFIIFRQAPRIRPCDSDVVYAAFAAIGSPSPPSGDALRRGSHHPCGLHHRWHLELEDGGLRVILTKAVMRATELAA
jgi:hypothetical protein